MFADLTAAAFVAKAALDFLGRFIDIPRIAGPLDIVPEITDERHHRSARVAPAIPAMAVDHAVRCGGFIAHRAAHAPAGHFLRIISHNFLLMLARELPDDTGKLSYGSLQFGI